MRNRARFTSSTVAMILIMFSVPVLPQAKTTVESSRQVRVITRQKGLGGGAALSADGNTFAYVGGDGSLRTRNLSTGVERLLIKDAGNGVDVFLNPAFSSDQHTIYFCGSGGTRYWPSNIFAIQTDGTGLQQFTSTPEIRADQSDGKTIYSRYFFAVYPSPDGKFLLARMYDGVAGVDRVALMKSDGSELRVISSGSPVGWDSRSRVIYFTDGPTLKSFDIRGNRVASVERQSGAVLGMDPNGDLYSLADTGDIIRWTLASKSQTRLAVPSAISVPTNFEELQIKSVQPTSSGRILLQYDGELTVIYEVVQP